MIEVLKQALEALETEVSIDWTNNDEFNASAEKMHDAITSLQQAIAELESQEPVAFKIYKPTPPRHTIPNVRDAELPWVYDQDPSSGNVASMWVTPIKHTHPPQPAKPIPCANHCEATAFEIVIKNLQGEIERLKASQRTWVGLTDEDDIDWEEGGNLKDLVKAIEAKLKQKNGYAEEKNT